MRMLIILPALFCVIYYLLFVKKTNQVYTYTDNDYPLVVNFEINERLSKVQRQQKALNLVLDALSAESASSWTDVAWNPT